MKRLKCRYRHLQRALATEVVFPVPIIVVDYDSKGRWATVSLATVSSRISLDPGSWLIIKLEAGRQDLSDTEVCLPSKIAPHNISRLTQLFCFCQ